MQVVNWKNCEKIEIKKFPYKGKMYQVKGISVRWLSKFGEDDMGQPEYGLRLFTAEPGGEIPIHNHFYIQTMYVLSGKFECWHFNIESDRRDTPCEAGSCGFCQDNPQERAESAWDRSA